MKRTITRLVSMLLVVILCFSLLPLEVLAWGKMTHTYTANQILNTSSGGTTSVTFPCVTEGTAKAYQYNIPAEYLEAIEAYPEAFRAGALGPDMYPDIFTGQVYIHPEDVNIDAGEWVTLLCDAVNKMGRDTEGRKCALSFTLGCILHYCGDLYGHDFVNTFSGGSFPSLLESDIFDLKGDRLNNILSHLSTEKYMDSRIYPTYDSQQSGNIDAPDEFVSNVMVFDGTPAAGLAAPYASYEGGISIDEMGSGLVKDILDDFFEENSNNVPPHYTAMLALRDYVNSVADKYRENMEPASAAITRYYDEWAKDIDDGISAFTTACDNIARRMITKEKNPDIEKKKEEERNEDKNEFWDLSGYNLKSMIGDEYSPQEVDAIVKKLEEHGIYGDSFFDLVLIELLLEGVITLDMVKGGTGSSVMIIKEEFDYWFDEYGVYMLGIPDIIIDGIEIPVIGDIIDLVLLKPVWSWIGGELKNIVAKYVASACTGMVTDVTGLTAERTANVVSQLVSKINDRMEDPMLQLDHRDNPYKPSENNFADLKDYMDRLPTNGEFTDSELEALYNTVTMFQLVLIGPDNYTNFIETHAGVRQTAYEKNTAYLEATSLKLEFKTSDLYLSGTDDNIYVVFYQVNKDGSKTRLTRKLLDISGANDFEYGDRDTYIVELPRSVKLTELEIALSKTPAFDFLPALTDDWCCESIQVTPMFAGYALTDPIDLGGVQLKGICHSIGMNFQEALKAGREPENQMTQTVTNLKVQIKVRDEQYAGSDSDIYLAAYNADTLWAKVCLDKAVYNDLEQGDNDTYMIPVTAVRKNIAGIPLKDLKLGFVHDGIDEANWEAVTVTPCYGALELTEPISLGGKKFEDTTWRPDLQSKLKKAACKQYAPFLLEYETSLDDGLVSYMGSLDGGEEWVDEDNELWANTTLRKKIFFELFKGFTPEIDYIGNPTALQSDPVELAFDLTGVWNGVSNDRRMHVKDFRHVYPVEGSAELTLVNESGEIVYTASDVFVINSFASHSIEADKLAPGYYDLRISYSPDETNPMYRNAAATFERALQVMPVDDFEIKKQPKDVTAGEGQIVTFSVEAAGGKTPYTYKWQYTPGNGVWYDADGSWCIGYNNDTLSFTVTREHFAHQYRCVITDAAGKTVTSKTVSVIEKFVAPLAVQIENGEKSLEYNVQSGKPKTLTANATGGTGPYTYTWYVKWPGGQWKEVSSGPDYELKPTLQSDLTLMVEAKDATGKVVKSTEVFILVKGIIIT